MGVPCRGVGRWTGCPRGPQGGRRSAGLVHNPTGRARVGSCRRHGGARTLVGQSSRGRGWPARTAPAGPRLRRILFRLQEASHPGSADAPGFRLHPLKGDRAGQWSVRVSGNWRVVFRFEDGEAVAVDLIDYH